MLLGSYFFDSLPVDVLRVRRRPEGAGEGAGGEGVGEGAGGAEASTVEALTAVEAVVPRLSCAARDEVAGEAAFAEAEAVFAYVPCDPATYYEPASGKHRGTAPSTASAPASAPASGPALDRLLASCLAEASIAAVPTPHVPTTVPTGAARCLWRLAALRRGATARRGVVPMMLLLGDKVVEAELTPEP